MRNLTDFKKRIKVGVMLETFNHNIGNMGIRSVSVVQKNSFAFETKRPDGTVIDSWCDFPKSKDIEIVDENTITIYWEINAERKPILTYRFV